MKDLSSRRLSSPKSGVTPRMVAIGFLILMLIGLVILMVLFAGGSSIDADESYYIDGKLKTIINYANDDQQTVWVQHTIYREDDLLTREKIGDTYSTQVKLLKGPNLVEYAVPLEPGVYKVFTYISTTDESPRRITGFISTVEA
ncbi:MAG TPA: hypothetical protein O0X27_01990 [Methanocorpusculum sp.]|nr:hypothetical protein [Methanocorpusculum sp.]